MKTTTNAKTANRQDLLNSMMHSQSAERILDRHRFGTCSFGLEMALMQDLFGITNEDDVDESDALFPACEVLKARGHDVDAMASAIEHGVITPEELGDLIASNSVSDVNNEIATLAIRHYDGVELDLGVLRGAGYDDENMATALYAGVVSKPQLILLVHNQTQQDVDTAVSAMLDRARSGWKN